ncbi:GNAT family N-acetyltransferase [Nonomuraea thailandensis]|uniref:GNAT family N-acetyltransferase n=1 Tax=Nonomuraea thailandensis TaxID=1188745 RepID=UPI0020A24212|nr:GNAT family protein [Nonomuraea thailandensis]
MSRVPVLAQAVEEDRSSYAFTLVPPCAGGGILPANPALWRGVAPLRVDPRDRRKAAGCTAFWDPHHWPGRQDLRAVEADWTWLAASAQGTTISAETRLLLFTHAFEVLGVTRVGLKTDARNQRSRRALERPSFEGVLRSWSPPWAPGEEGLLRDSPMFSLIATEWPAVEAAPQDRLAESIGEVR